LVIVYVQESHLLRHVQMTTAVYQKLDIAGEYLDAAMQMYLEQRDYFCAIHLAGAAAELLDRHLPKEDRTFGIAQRAQKELHCVETGDEASDKEINEVLNGPKNAIKHTGNNERTVTLDPVCEAEWWIESALTSWEKLKLRRTPTGWRYQDYRNAELRSEAAPTMERHTRATLRG
jgi:hypothetical protein